MLIFILIPLALALARGYRIAPLFRVADMYPFFLMCAVHGFFVINAWLGNHAFVKFAEPMQYCMTLTLLLPVVRRRIITPTLIGAGGTIVGTVMNKIVIAANGGKMPVYPTLSKWIGYYKEGQLDGTSKLPFLADYIDLGLCILSPGDVLIHAFASIVLYFTVKAVCPRRGAAAQSA